VERWCGKAAAAEGVHQRGVKSVVFFEKMEDVATGLLVGADQFRQEFSNGPGAERVKVADKALELDLDGCRAVARQGLGWVVVLDFIVGICQNLHRRCPLRIGRFKKYRAAGLCGPARRA
jgi:hypothetical protein